MKFSKYFFQSARLTWKSWGGRFLVLLSLSVITAGLVISQTTLPPEVKLPAEPLFMNGAKTKGNLMLALSVEFPTVGQTYRDNFDMTKEYVGYFDPKACYRTVPASANNSTGGEYFDWQTNKGSVSATCPSSQFDGNFMNWATSSAIDIMRYGLTGGNRTVDDANTTVVDRAWLPDFFYNSSSFFSEKFVPVSSLPGRTELSSTLFPDGMWIYNCKNRVYFAKAKDTNSLNLSSCDAPFGVPNAQSPNLIKANASKTGNFYQVRNLVCDPSSAENRIMRLDPDTKKWSGLCYKYPSGKYKPVGQFQVNAENLRVGVTSYLQDDSRLRYGGVLRSPLKYLGPKNYDINSNLLTAENVATEWSAVTGVFVNNPQNGDPIYGDEGFGQSGAITYINKFGTLNPLSIGKYKTLDPLSELYYETIRYLQGKQPTPEAVLGLVGPAAATQALKENFPAYKTWADPFVGFVDTSDSGKGCLRNNIVTIADVFTHSDRSVPGNTIIGNLDFIRSAETAPALDVPFWTSVVGSFESKTKASATVNYLDSQGTSQVAGNLASNKLYNLSNAASVDTGADGGSYYMSGLAYWANTQSFRTDLPKGRISSYSIDVNENRASDNVDFRRTRQLYLAAKYGGFDDSAAGRTGNPYNNGSNSLWQGSDGDAKNYFLVSDAAKFLDSISEVFARIVEETGSIAGGAISTQRLTVAQAAAVYQARFNPVANFWSGRMLKYGLTLDATGTTLVVGDTPVWEAGQVITTQANIDRGDSRNIVIGSPIGQQATVPATNYTWAALAQAHKDSLNQVPYVVPTAVDTLGASRLAYLRGDRTNEAKAATPLAPFRARDTVLGDIVNSGLVYVGAPAGNITDSGYTAFYSANKTRRPVIYANANDGMLHAIDDSTGNETFAYIPGFVAGKMNLLTSEAYSHISINDATPAIAEAYVGTKWSTVLVSGVGGGGQGVFALDVTNPATFKDNPRANVLWEFTDRDHPAMGNVIGTPQIVKLRTTDSSSTTPTFKWYAIVASGVNNYQQDGFASTTGNPSLFILDLARKPIDTPASAAWTEGTNFWRIELPQTSTAIAKGLVGLTTVKNFSTNAVDTLFAGDMQGNVWKLDFSLRGVSRLTSVGTDNLPIFNAKAGSSTPFFIAKDGTGISAKVQPITGEPVVTNAFFNGQLVSFGTGKFLEVADTTVPAPVGDSFYTLLDNGNAVTDQSMLQQGSVAADGQVTVPKFVYGASTPSAPTQKMGWYFNFDKSSGERQVSDITAQFRQLFFGSLSPTKGSCGEGGGRFYAINAVTGNGLSEISTVGLLAAPLLIEIGSSSLTSTDATGQRTASRRVAVITQGSKGLKVAATSGGGLTYQEQVGRLSWRQINNYRENKNN